MYFVHMHAIIWLIMIIKKDFKSSQNRLTSIAFSGSITDKMLIDVSMRACSYFNDSQSAIEAMRQACIDMPREFRGDLFKHFQEAYPS